MSARPVGELSIGQRQVVAIVKALSYASRVLIMDEPTAALTVGEVDRLFEIMRRLGASGVGIVYISHRLEEVPADRRPGDGDARRAGRRHHGAPMRRKPNWCGCWSAGRWTNSIPSAPGAPAGRCSACRDASFRPARGSAGWQAPTRISLDVHEGEIVGLAGVMGAGRTELLSALYGTGLSGHWEGDVEIDGRPVKLSSIRAARSGGRRLRHGRPARQRPDAEDGARPQSRHVGARGRISPAGFMSPRARRRR